MIVVVGCGATGSNLLPMLARFTDEMVLIVDGDNVESKNIRNQAFQRHDVGLPKSKAMATKLNAVLKDNRFKYWDEYLSDNNILNIYKYCSSIELIIGCVDNHPVRILLEEFSKAQKIPYIDSANEDFNGEVILTYNVVDEENFKYRSDLFPHIKEDKSNDPTRANCNAQIDDGVLQQYNCNVQAANIIMQMYERFINDVALKNEMVVFNIKTSTTRLINGETLKTWNQ